MNVYQFLVLIFALGVIALNIGAIVAVLRSPTMRLKPLWIAGSLFGFMGLGINWTSPDDVFLLFGVSIPVVMIFMIQGSSQIIVKTGIPIVAIVALLKARSAKRQRT